MHCHHTLNCADTLNSRADSWHNTTEPLQRVTAVQWRVVYNVRLVADHVYVASSIKAPKLSTALELNMAVGIV